MDFLWGFFVGFVFFPIFTKFFYPKLLDLILEFAEKEKDRVDAE